MLTVENLVYIHENTAPFCYDLTLVPGDTKGHTHLLTGKNGSGKSTLMDLIAGFLEPHSGDIIWQGQSLLGLPTRKRPVSYLVQDPVCFAHLSVVDTLHLVVSNDQDINQAFDFFDHSIKLTQKMADLSGGQRQLVLFLQALLQRRPILLLDEPFSALDAATEKQARLYLEKHQAKTQCVILLSHHAYQS